MPAELVPPDQTGAGLDELLAKALRPVAVDIHVDPVTLDRVFTLHFEEHPPAHIVVGPCEVTAILKDLARVVTKSLN